MGAWLAGSECECGVGAGRRWQLARWGSGPCCWESSIPAETCGCAGPQCMLPEINNLHIRQKVPPTCLGEEVGPPLPSQLVSLTGEGGPMKIVCSWLNRTGARSCHHQAGQRPCRPSAIAEHA